MQGFTFSPQREIVILNGARTPFGAFCGSFKDVSATALGVSAAKAALERSGVRPEWIDQTIFGNVIQSSPDAAYLARHVGLHVGVRIDSTAVTLNRLCGSGFEAVIAGAKEILLGRAKFALCGGSENMTQSPFQLWGGRTGIALGQAKMTDSLSEGLRDSYNGLPMGVTAENLAKKYDVTRQDSDQLSLESQQKAEVARQRGVFAEEIVAVEVKKKGKVERVETDEHPRPATTIEALAKLPLVFDKEGIVTAGSSSGICDGAAAMVLTSKDEAERRGLSYLATLRAYGVSGCDPSIMGIGPVHAARSAVLDLGKSIDDMEVVEVNEAFAPQVIAVERELGLKRSRLNVNGGAIALGHPLGASGARITLSLALELRRSQKRWGLGSACIGGGQGIAVILESNLA